MTNLHVTEKYRDPTHDQSDSLGDIEGPPKSQQVRVTTVQVVLYKEYRHTPNKTFPDLTRLNRDFEIPGRLTWTTVELHEEDWADADVLGGKLLTLRAGVFKRRTAS